MADMVDQPYEHDVQTGGTPMIPDPNNPKLGLVPVSIENQSDVPTYENEDTGKADIEANYDPFTTVTAQGVMKTGSGFVHSVNVSPLTATPTAGLLKIRDSITDGAGTILWQGWIFATASNQPILLDENLSTGLYADFDGTLANISISASGR